jgi:hypothetical protein
MFVTLVREERRAPLARFGDHLLQGADGRVLLCRGAHGEVREDLRAHVDVPHIGQTGFDALDG